MTNRFVEDEESSDWMLKQVGLLDRKKDDKNTDDKEPVDSQSSEKK